MKIFEFFEHYLLLIETMFFSNIRATVHDTCQFLSIFDVYIVFDKQALAIHFGTLSYFFIFKITVQWICIKFHVKNKIKCSEVMQMLEKAFGKDAISKPRVYDWFKHFQESHEYTDNAKRTGCLCTSTTKENMEKIKNIMLNNCWISIKKIAEEVGISYVLWEAILTFWAWNKWHPNLYQNC